MKAVYKGRQVELWEICKTGMFPEWVESAFKANLFQWDGNNLKILSNAFRPSGFHGLTSGFGIGVNTQFGKIGDFVELETGKIISAKKVHEKYKKID